MKKQDANDDYINPNPLARFLLLAFILIVVLIMMMILPELESLQPPNNATPAQIDQAINDLNSFLKQLFLYTILFSLFISLYFVYLAVKINQYGRFPPPNFWVIRRTRIHYGRQANRHAVLALFIALLCWFPVLVLFYLQWIIQTQFN